MKHNHYFRDVSHLDQVDVYRILELFEVTCPVAQHIVKKALAAGKRGAKDSARDMQDIADSAARWLEMREEDDGIWTEPADDNPTPKPQWCGCETPVIDSNVAWSGAPACSACGRDVFECAWCHHRSTVSLPDGRERCGGCSRTVTEGGCGSPEKQWCECGEPTGASFDSKSCSKCGSPFRPGSAFLVVGA